LVGAVSTNSYWLMAPPGSAAVNMLVTGIIVFAATAWLDVLKIGGGGTSPVTVQDVQLLQENPL